MINYRCHCEGLTLASRPWQSHKVVNPRFIYNLWDSHGSQVSLGMTQKRITKLISDYLKTKSEE